MTKRMEFLGPQRQEKWKQRNPFLRIEILPNHRGMCRSLHKREDQFGHKRPSNMQRDMVPRMDHIGKSRNQNCIPSMLNYCLISLM